MKNVVPPLSPEELAGRFADIHPPFSDQEAVVESNRCLFCFDAPCTAACPTHIDVPRFIKKISSGNLRGSALTILDSNILGLSCSRVCPVDVLCEGACVMHRYNKAPIEIGRLQRHAMDHFYAHGARLPVENDRRGRVACIGAGPASLACAAELRRKGHAVTVFDSRPMAGGLNTYGVAEYKFRPADAQREIEMIRSLGVEFRNGVQVGRDISIDEIEMTFDVVFLGVGLGATQSLGIEGETLSGVIDAVTFIADYKTATAKVGRRVVVIGGGNTAIDAACAARRLGAEEVTIVYRRTEAEMPAFRFEVEHARQDGVEFLWVHKPVAIRGQDVVESIEFHRGSDSSTFGIPCDTVIVAIGQSKLLDDLAATKAIGRENGRIVVDPQTGQTANRRYYAGGDCVNGGREVVDAVAEGTRAGRAIAVQLAQAVASERS